jgi:WD40 repeat protein
MKEEAFKSQPGRRFSALMRGLGVVMLMFLTSTIETDLLEHAEASSVKLVHEKDLVIGGEPVAITWSPDSKLIAFVRWGYGVAALIDVETGVLTEIPKSQINGMSAIAWSSDSKLLAVLSHDELKVIQLSDLTVLNELRMQSGLSFNDASAFSRDNKFLIIQRGGWNPPHLYAYRLSDGSIEPFLTSPLGHQQTALEAGRFTTHDHRLYFTVEIDRLDEERKPAVQGIPNAPMMNVPHPSCYVFELSEDMKVVSTRWVDVNKWVRPGASAWVPTHCAVSGDAKFVVAKQPVTSDETARREKRSASPDVLFHVFDLATGAPVIGFDPLPPDGNPAKQIDLHPSKPWAVTVSSDIALPSSELSAWDFRSGENLARVNGPKFLRDPRISSDGSQVVFWAANGVIPIYRFQSN